MINVNGRMWKEVERRMTCYDRYLAALRLIVESENNTLSYPEDLYYRVLKIAKEALQEP